jgi:hypothetical protein
MPRIPKRLLALGGLLASGGAAASAFRKRRAERPSSPAPSPAAPAPAPTDTPAPAAPAGTASTPEPMKPEHPPAPPAAVAPANETAPIAPPPLETPGPSVTAPKEPASSTEREEAADATTPDPEILSQRAGGPVDELVERETAAAAAEAAGIGGRRSGDAVADDPAMVPVYEAGGGEAEGFEQAEADLIENASHGDGGGNPLRDAFTPEVESDAATAVDAEADEEKVSEKVQDVNEAETTTAEDAERAREDDPGAGPGRTHEV